MMQASAEKLDTLGLPNRKRLGSVPQSEQLAEAKGASAKKKHSHLLKSRDHEKGDSQGTKKTYLGKKEEGQS